MSRKIIFYSITIIATTVGCGQPGLSGNNKQVQPKTNDVTGIITNKPNSSNYPGNLFTLSDAEKILGEPAHLTDSSSTIKGDTLRYSSAYFANNVDLKSGKTGCIYFTFEKYNQISLAQSKYSFIKAANENNGIKVLTDIGDEAYFHTDGQGFYFIMVRKGMNVFNMKVNKITSKTSLDEFNLVAKKIADSL